MYGFGVAKPTGTASGVNSRRSPKGVKTSLASQFPRPVREYVWLGAHPVAVVDSIESSAEIVTPKGFSFVHSGHLGEPLSETDASGRLLRQYAHTFL